MANANDRINDDMAAYWMPFTPNKDFKANPRMLKSADGLYYTTTDGRKVFDGSSGLWCCALGHNQPKIVEAIQQQAARLDYATSFGYGHPDAFKLSNMLADRMPDGLDHIFYTNSGSESVETALKMALGYHRLNGQGERTRLIGRVGGYHGVGFGGISVGGMVNNRKTFGSLLPGVDHLPGVYDETMLNTRGQTEGGVHYADALEDIIKLHDPSTIAAVIVEPAQGSAGVYVPPKGYLERLREITSKYGILLIFDEVITAFGRLGYATASERFGIVPDIIATAKALNNGTVPMGAVAVHNKVYDTFMEKSAPGVEFFHGYTYSAHPLAVAAAIATQELYDELGVYENVRTLESYFEEAIHTLAEASTIVDARNFGFMAALTFDRIDDKPASRSAKIFQRSFENGLKVRLSTDSIAIAPPLVSTKADIDVIFDVMSKTIKDVG
ncbi:aminotransferase class III-fold pyridoxal phosphate-dependent enzyme [Kordiimonas aquimaris]|uniref:aminotransferase class III-fold pyridoxal phosphate-dependent enzyme n=1 Tax=Kordiimonas aquimaris TaxID=707591 RepID=UPI0021CE421D|nr:aminotransferase class III-fold pyridoxal phosphate-dependent enzyme [Kordiimonas aquimaris]